MNRLARPILRLDAWLALAAAALTALSGLAMGTSGAQRAMTAPSRSVLAEHPGNIASCCDLAAHSMPASQESSLCALPAGCAPLGLSSASSPQPHFVRSFWFPVGLPRVPAVVALPPPHRAGGPKLSILHRNFRA